MITLYDYELSGNCYKLRLFMALLGVPYAKRHVDFYPGFEHKSEWFLALNPLGQLPVIEDDGCVLCDAQAILIYLARKYDTAGRWYPTGDAALLGQIGQWLSFAEGLTATASAARLHDGFFFDVDIERARAGGYKLLEALDEHLWLAERRCEDWLCPPAHPTVADIACFPYVMLSEEGGIYHRDYPSVRRWTDRVKRIPGFVVMPGIFPASATALAQPTAVA
jgi:glutathione S-transferase